MARFEGTDTYVATEDLMMAVNASVTLGRPLLVKGEPGTGKTRLAEEVAASLGRPFIQWHIKSTTKAQQGLYEYDAVSRLRDSQLGDDRVHDIKNYIEKGKLWEAFEADKKVVSEMSAEAENGDGEAMYNLALLYETGQKGLTMDVDEAIYWFKKSSDANYPSGMFAYGSYLLSPEGKIKKNIQLFPCTLFKD